MPILSKDKHFELTKHNQTIDILNASFWHFQGDELGTCLLEEDKFSSFSLYNNEFYLGTPLLKEKITKEVAEILVQKLRTEASNRYFYLNFSEDFDEGHATGIYLHEENVFFIDAVFGIFTFKNIDQFATWLTWFLGASCYAFEYQSLELKSLDFEKRSKYIVRENAIKALRNFQIVMIASQEYEFLLKFQKEVFPQLQVLQKIMSLSADPVDLFNKAEELSNNYKQCLEKLRKLVPERITMLKEIQENFDFFIWNESRSSISSALFNYQLLQKDLSRNNIILDQSELGVTYWHAMGIQALKTLLSSVKELESVLNPIILEEDKLLSKVLAMKATKDKYKQELSKIVNNLVSSLSLINGAELDAYKQIVLNHANKQSFSDSYTSYLKSSMLKIFNFLDAGFKQTIQYWNYEKNFDDNTFISSYKNSLKNHCIKHLTEADSNKRIQGLDLDYSQLSKHYQSELMDAANDQLTEIIKKELAS